MKGLKLGNDTATVVIHPKSLSFLQMGSREKFVSCLDEYEKVILEYSTEAGRPPGAAGRERQTVF